MNKKDKELNIELDVATLATPLAIVIGAIIISIPLSLSLYFGLRGSGMGLPTGNVALAAECDESAPYSDGCLYEQAEEIGLDLDSFAQCLEERPYDSDVDDDLALGEEIGVSGTPSVFIGENEGSSARAFSIGAGATIEQIEEAVSIIQESGVEAAVENWKETQLADLDNYEQQLRDFYSEQGQTGEALESSVETGLEQRRAEIDSSVEIQTVEIGNTYGKGNENAETVLIEFSDYECPFCQRFAQGVGAQLSDGLVADGELYMLVKEFPLESIHTSARKLSNAALCAGEQGKYYEMHDQIFGIV